MLAFSDILYDAMSRIIIQMEEDLLDELDAAAREDQISRSAFVRDSIVLTLAERRRRRELQQVVDSYRQQPQEQDLVVPAASRRRIWPE